MANLYNRIRNSAVVQRLLRVLQFISAAVSLGFFSARLYRIIVQAKSVTRSNGAVEGILAAAVAYGLLAMMLKCCVKRGGPNWLRWLLVLLDILFLAAFIVVARLTRPNGGSSGPCRKTIYTPIIPKGQNCQLPWATFITAIVSTVLYALSAIFHEAKSHHDKKKAEEKAFKEGRDDQYGARNNSNMMA